MNTKGNITCYLSGSKNADLSAVRSILNKNNIVCNDVFDLSIESTLQTTLINKIKQSDFAIFVISGEDKDILFEIGVCEGVGTQYLVIIDKIVETPFFLENKQRIYARIDDEEFLSVLIQGYLDKIKIETSKKADIEKVKPSLKRYVYNKEVHKKLEQLIEQCKTLRYNGSGQQLEILTKEILEVLNIKYYQNTNSDKGVDFAIWIDKLGKLIGNPIIIETKYGNLNKKIIQNAENTLISYTRRSKSRAAIFLYLDSNNSRYKLNASLNPLIIGYDVEDLLKDLVYRTFETVILFERNKIAHGYT